MSGLSGYSAANSDCLPTAEVGRERRQPLVSMRRRVRNANSTGAIDNSRPTRRAGGVKGGEAAERCEGTLDADERRGRVEGRWRRDVEPGATLVERRESA
jgi:hypothetical protein